MRVSRLVIRDSRTMALGGGAASVSELAWERQMKGCTALRLA